jgi:diadenosine tetraphosphate (Ap4A) HIT family hydrolase
VLNPLPERQEPAARRRRFLFCVALLITAGCSQAPPDPSDWDGFRSALQRAAREVRATDPEAAAEVERLIAEAEIVTARENAVSSWRRKPGRTPAAWGHAMVTANRALTSVRSERAELSARLALLLKQAEVSIGAAEGRIGLAGVDGSHVGETASARYHVTTARKLAEDGEYRAALEHAKKALVLAAGLDHSWNQSIERFSEPTRLALWREQAAETIGDSRRTGGAAIVVDKLRHRLVLYEGGRERAVFNAELGGNGLERKLHTGDRATPEGRYKVTVKKSGGATKYHLALLIDYPNAADLRRYRAAEASGEVRRGTGAGSLIEIHGQGGSGRDWTDGCVALSNEDMEKLFPLVRVGTPVTIVGTL